MIELLKYNVVIVSGLIKVNGDISFGISTIDRQNGAPYNKNGVYSIKLFVDDKPNPMIKYFIIEFDKQPDTRPKFNNYNLVDSSGAIV